MKESRFNEEKPDECLETRLRTSAFRPDCELQPA